MKKNLTSIVIMVIIIACSFSVYAVTPAEVEFMHKVEKQLGKIKTLQADFIQRRTLKLLEHQAVFSGRIFMQAPDRLAWHVDKPIRYSCIIKGDRMTQWDADSNETTTISAKKISALQLVIRQLQYWFSGNFAALKSDFSMRINIKAHTLNFVPKPATPPARFIKEIRVKLCNDLHYIKQLTIYEKSGDMMTINFTTTIINRPLPANAWMVGAH